MKRLDIIETIGKKFLTANIENDEFSYLQVLKRPIKDHWKLDIRFFDEKSNVAVLVEAKRIYKAKDVKQLFAYVDLEQELSNRTKIIAILANTDNDLFQIWKIEKDSQVKLNDTKLKTMEEYIRYFQSCQWGRGRRFTYIYS